MKCEQLEDELGSHIGLRIRFGGLRSKSEEWEEDKEWCASMEEDKKRETDRQLPKIIADGRGGINRIFR